MKLEDVKQIEDGLYRFLSSIHIDGIPWFLEYFPDSKNTALLFKRSGYAKEDEHYIGGGYRAVFPFEIFIQRSKKDTKARLDISRVLYAIHQALQEEQDQEFPRLKLDGAIPQEIEMTDHPKDYTGEQTPLATFYASFSLTYEKKGRFD